MASSPSSFRSDPTPSIPGETLPPHDVKLGEVRLAKTLLTLGMPEARVELARVASSFEIRITGRLAGVRQHCWPAAPHRRRRTCPHRVGPHRIPRQAGGRSPGRAGWRGEGSATSRTRSFGTYTPIWSRLRQQQPLRRDEPLESRVAAERLEIGADRGGAGGWMRGRK